MKMTRHEFLKVFIVAIGSAAGVAACSSSDPAPSSSSGGSSSGGTDGGGEGGGTGGDGGGTGGDAGGGIDAAGGGNCTANGAKSAGYANSPNHNSAPHAELLIPAADFANPTGPKTYVTGPGGGSGHTHEITLTPADIQQLASGQPLTKTSSTASSGSAHTHDITLVCA